MHAAAIPDADVADSQAARSRCSRNCGCDCFMIPAREPIHRPPDAKLLFVRRSGALEHRSRRDFVRLLRPGDLVVANDAATSAGQFDGHPCSQRACYRGAPGGAALAGSSPGGSLLRRCVWAREIFGREPRIGPRRPPSIPGDTLMLGSCAPPWNDNWIIRDWLRCISTARRRRSGLDSRAMAGPSSMRTSRSRWRSTTPGARLPLTRRRLRRHRRGSC